MSEENVELHRRGYDAWNRGDVEGWLGLVDAKVEIIPMTAQFEGGGPLRGHGSARRLWESWAATFPDRQFEVDQIRDLGGDTTIAAVRFQGRGVGSGVPVEQQVWHVIWWRNKKIARWQAFPTEADALEAAGLSE